MADAGMAQYSPAQEPTLPPIESPVVPDVTRPQALPAPTPQNGPPAYTPSPYDLLPNGPPQPGQPVQPSAPTAEQQGNDRIRWRQIRTITAREPFAIYLLQRADLAQTMEVRREYLRLYYQWTCKRMRALEPRLAVTINTYERLNMSRVSQLFVKPTIPLRILDRHGNPIPNPPPPLFPPKR